MSTYDLIVIGAGPGGYTAALRAVDDVIVDDGIGCDHNIIVP